MIIKIINFLVFQVGWIVVVYFHNHKAAVFCFLLVIFNCIVTKQYKLRHIIAILIVAILGIFNDFVLFMLGLISFPTREMNIFPLWLVALWLLFISTFGSSLQWMRNLSLLPMALLGGLGGAISYYYGTTVAGAIQYQGIILPQLLLHFFNWFLLFPFIYKLFWTINNNT